MFETLRKSVEMLPSDTRARWLMLVPLAIITGAAEMGAAAGVFALVSLLTASLGSVEASGSFDDLCRQNAEFCAPARAAV